MDNYKYKSRDFFVEKINYEYSQYSDQLFYQWKRNRENFIKKIESKPEKVDWNININDKIDLLFFFKIIKSKSNFRVLNYFVKKFEVHGRLFKKYDKEFKAIKRTGLAEIQLYIFFADLLIFAWEKKKNFQYLSSLLKLCDNLASVDVLNLSNKDQKNLKFILSYEKKIITSLFKNILE